MRSAPALLPLLPLLALLALCACRGGAAAGPAKLCEEAKSVAVKSEGEVRSLLLMQQEAKVAKAGVQHILIAWKELGNAWGTGMDKRARARSFEDARAEVRRILRAIDGGADFEALLRAHSEDPGSVSGKVYDAAPGSKIVAGLRTLGLRLEIGEVGVAGSRFGFHVVRRVR